MVRAGALIALAGIIFGCAETVQERVRAYNDDGVLLFKSGDYAHAREIFQAALALKPSDCTLQFNIGQCYDRLGQDAKAEQAYGECLKIDPNQAECRHQLAALLWRGDRKPEACKMIEDWLAKQPDSPAALALHGWMFRQEGDLPKAKSRLQQALAIDGKNQLALIELAQVYEAENRLDRAVFLYERAMADNPNQPEIAHRLATLKVQGVSRPRPD